MLLLQQLPWRQTLYACGTTLPLPLLQLPVLLPLPLLVLLPLLLLLLLLILQALRLFPLLLGFLLQVPLLLSETVVAVLLQQSALLLVPVKRVQPCSRKGKGKRLLLLSGLPTA